WTFGYVSAAAFPGRDTAYVAGAEQFFLPGQQAFLIGTTDGGQTWPRRPLPPLAALPEAVAFRDGRHGVVGADTGTILRTADGGQTWQQPASGTRNRLRSAVWVDARTLYVGGDSATICRSADGGQTWQAFQADSLTYSVGGVGGQVLHIALSRQYSFDYLCFTSSLVGYSMLAGWLARTTDGGHTWTVVPTLTNGAGIRSVAFRDAHHGLAFGNSVWRTTDGGLTWTSIAQFFSNRTYGGSGYESSLVRGTATDDYNAWVVGDVGRILRYSEKFIQTDTAATQSLAYCTGDTATIAFDTTGVFSPTERNFRVELSNKMGRFRPNETTILPLLGAASASPLRAVLPAGLAAGTRYRLRVIRADSSVLGGDNERDLTIWPRPTAVAVAPADSARFCAGDSVQLTAPAGFAEYNWNTPTTATTPSIWVKTAGVYSVAVAAGGGCFGPASAPVTVRVTPRPAAPVLALNQSGAGPALLTATPALPGGTYVWTGPGGVVAGATGPTLLLTAAAQNGAYTVSVTVRGCVSALSPPVQVTITGLPAEADAAGLTLSPNPAGTVVQVRSGAGVRAVTVFDLAGRQVSQVAGSGADAVLLPVGALPTGTYLVRVLLRDGRPQNRRLLVAH
ncbi:MAG: T9SS type A sorting domain-containing protein, partial [Hymenobacteraceae bacterium]|nr:T9SS type A sorting domain-containing protein [Hymenobacteraceae bacterium]